MLWGELHMYWVSDTGSAEKEYCKKQLVNLMVPSHLHFCIDSQVMLIKNTDETLMNGRGEVIKFVNPHMWNNPAPLLALLPHACLPTHSPLRPPIRSSHFHLTPTPNCLAWPWDGP